MSLEGHVYGSYEAYFDRFAPGTKNRTGRRRIGYITVLGINSNVTTLKGLNPDEGIPVQVAEVQTAVEYGMNLTCESIDGFLLAAVFLGSSSVFSQSNTPVSNEAITVLQGCTYQLGAALGHGMGVRNVSSVVVTNVAGDTTYDLTDDYTLDAAMGTITIVEGGAIADDTVVHVDYTPATESREVIVTGSTVAEGELFLKSNAPQGTKRDVLFTNVKLTLNGDYTLKGDNQWQQLPIQAAISQKDSDTPAFLFQGRG